MSITVSVEELRAYEAAMKNHWIEMLADGIDVIYRSRREFELMGFDELKTRLNKLVEEKKHKQPRLIPMV